MTQPLAPFTPHPKRPASAHSPWQLLSFALGRQGLSIAADTLEAGLPATVQIAPEMVVRALHMQSCAAQLRRYPVAAISNWVCPALIWTHSGQMWVLLEAPALNAAGADSAVKKAIAAKVLLPEFGDIPVDLDRAQLEAQYSGVCVLFKAKSQTQQREPAWLQPPEKHWLWSALWAHKWAYAEAVLATVIINVLALVGTFYTMNVYDRVIPNNAFATLWVLSIGVLAAQVLEFIARGVRAYLVDEVSKKTDLNLGMKLFAHALATRLEYAPQSSGTYANMLREYETVRDFFTSLTLAVIADLPFVCLFIAVMAMVAPALAWMTLAAAPVMVVVALVAQWPLGRLARQKLGDSSRRQGMLVEALENLEAVKANRAQGYLQGLWESMSASLANASKQSALISHWVNNTANFIQQSASVVLIIVGTYLIAQGQLTQGALVGCMMLMTRALSPLSQLIALSLRVQQVKVALTTLAAVMATPIDRSVRPIALSSPQGHLALREATFSYGEGLPLALKATSLVIQPGERVVLLGRVGSGKSTLLRLLAGLYQPTQGLALLDGVNLAQIEPSNARRVMGFVGQDARLFFGTLADNIRLNRSEVSEADMMAVLHQLHLMPLVNSHPLGLSLPVGEHGRSLSGGQRQLVSLARTLVTRPQVMLLDEPTSAMDEQTEQTVFRAMSQHLGAVTLVMSTHRHALLSVATRVIVLDAGRIVLDAPRDAAIEALKKGLNLTDTPAQPTHQGSLV